jgi:hypothetical protein
MSGLGEGNWIAATPCEPAEETTAMPHGVPHDLVGENPFIAEQVNRTGLPVDALRGGPATTYTEYRLKLADALKLPK